VLFCVAVSVEAAAVFVAVVVLVEVAGWTAAVVAG